MTRRLPLLCALASFCALACGEAPGEPSPTEPIGSSAEREAGATPAPYGEHGVPGPWWREHGTREAFDRDVHGCREESTRARLLAPEDEQLDAAYRAFLDCMVARLWSRGLPPTAHETERAAPSARADDAEGGRIAARRRSAGTAR